MSLLFSVRRVAAVGLALTGLAACADRDSARLPATGPTLDLANGAALVSCPTSESRSATGTIGSLGGTLSVAGSSITLPAGAVPLPVEFTLTVPASDYMAVEITAGGEEHLIFDHLVTIQID